MRIRLYAARAMVNAMPTRSSPRNLIWRQLSTDFSQPKISSIRLRFCWLSP
jgi:hypothetical protein